MQIITPTEFRANQGKYLAMAEKERVLIARRQGKPIVLVTASDDDMLSAADLQSIRRGLDDLKNGRCHKMRHGESLTELLKRTEPCTMFNWERRVSDALVATSH